MKRYYDYKCWFKVKVISVVNEVVNGVIKWTDRVLVKPYKIIEDRWYVFKNTYIRTKKELLAL